MEVLVQAGADLLRRHGGGQARPLLVGVADQQALQANGQGLLGAEGGSDEAVQLAQFQEAGEGADAGGASEVKDPVQGGGGGATPLSLTLARGGLKLVSWQLENDWFGGRASRLLSEGDAMKHIPKQDWMGCAIATAAMLADLTYEEVAARPALPDLPRTRWPKQLRALLEGVTDSKWRVTNFWFRRPVLYRFSFPEWPVAVFLQDAPFCPRLGQWVVVKRELVHDPGERRVYTVSKYPRRHWRIASRVQPRLPVVFAEDQARRPMKRIRQVLEMEGIL